IEVGNAEAKSLLHVDDEESRLRDFERVWMMHLADCEREFKHTNGVSTNDERCDGLAQWWLLFTPKKYQPIYTEGVRKSQARVGAAPTLGSEATNNPLRRRCWQICNDEFESKKPIDRFLLLLYDPRQIPDTGG